MLEVLLAIIIFGLLVAGMAVGVLMGGKPIAGSCGGVGAALGEENYTCDICGDDPQKCSEQDNLNVQAYNAMDFQPKSS
ncbi:MAG: (Na+)-NQR maturation NqrM [Porticoccaceae bacterium]|nr:(Na+)-NQR maturation NqrM [Porticoccaceae bacterium]MDG1474348.1 (Na+)-NQR maturation NqrM [Porticoccaceae bacterium]